MREQQNCFMVGGHQDVRNCIKGHSIKKVGKHCVSRNLHLRKADTRPKLCLRGHFRGHILGLHDFHPISLKERCFQDRHLCSEERVSERFASILPSQTICSFSEGSLGSLVLPISAFTALWYCIIIYQCVWHSLELFLQMFLDLLPSPCKGELLVSCVGVGPAIWEQEGWASFLGWNTSASARL